MSTDYNSERYGVGEIILEEIKQLINSVNYGKITIKIHAGRVTKVEVTHEKSFDDLWQLVGGDGI